MPGVYVYDYDDVDLDTTGRVGDLQPVECHFDEKKNGESVLTLRLIYDDLNKWAAVKVGSYIKAMVPVRVPPKITDHAYDREIMTWRVKSAVTERATVWESCGEPDVSTFYPEQKGLFYAVAVQGAGGTKKRVKVKFHAPAGTNVQLLEERDDGRVKIYAEGRGTGWTFRENLEWVADTTIPDTFDGVESVVTPSRLAYQLFQVTSIEQTLEYVDITAQHVFYELLHSYTNYKSDYPVEAFAAIEGVFGGMVTVDERFTCLTDSAEKAGALDFERRNVVQALLDPEEGICAQYGLSLIRDNYDLYALKNVGSDRGFVVEYAKNMLAIDRTEDMTDVVTRIIPYGRTKKGDPVFLDGTIWVDSPRIDDYSFPRTMYLDCSDTATESDTMTLAQVKENLRERAQAEFDAGCDLPALSMTVDFISLGDTEEYRQFRDLDKVYLFDRITVRDRVRGYDYNAEVVAIRHNVLTGLLESVKVGSLQKGSGKRKIATWQVPEVDGSNIRLASIAAGVLAGGAVGEENIQTGAVSTRVIAAGSITSEKIEAGSITTDKLAAKSVTADKLDADFVVSDFIEAGSITTEMLAAGAVTADKIDAGAVTAGKIGAGAVTANAIASGAVAADKIAANAVTADKIAANAVTAGKIAANAVTADKVAAGAVTAGKIAANAVTADKINAGAVTADKVAAGAVTAGKIAANAVTADKIASNAVTANAIAAGTITAESGIIANGAIGTTQIADGSITDAKIVGLTANKITAGTLDASQIAVINLVADNITTGTINGKVIPVLGSDKLAAGAVTAGKIAENAVTADTIVAGAVTTDKLAANAVTANKILSGAVTTDKLAANAVTAVKIDSGAVTADKIAANAVTAGKIAANAVTADKVASNAITAGKIAAGAVTAGKIAADAVTADNIAAGSITTGKVSSDFGDSLDLSSNTSIKQIVSGLTQTYVQFKKPTGTFNVGDVWVKTNANTLWSALQDKTWTDVNAKQWGEWALSDLPQTYAWNGSKWVLTVDYNVVLDNSTSITQTRDAISLKADKNTVNVLTGTVMNHSTEIRQTAEAVSIKATEKDPATYVKTSTVTVSPDGIDIASGGAVNIESGGHMEIAAGAGLNIQTGGALTVAAENFTLDAQGNMDAKSASLEDATISGNIFVNGSPALSQRNIYVGTNAPASPVSGMVWIRPDTSTSAQTTFSHAIAWGERLNLVNNQKSGSLTGTATAAVGTAYTYRIRVPVYISPYSGGTTGAVLHFEIATASGGTAVLAATKNVTITDYGSGNKVIEMEVTGSSWIGNQSTLYFKLYATALSGYYAYNVLNSSDTGASITVECISTSSSGASGWRDCAVFCYA